MAAVATFKQACPTCGAMVRIKETMVGKKVECTECKDKFLAARPEDATPRGKSKTGGNGKKPTSPVDDDEDAEAPVQAKSRNGKPRAAAADDEGEGEAEAASKSKEGGSNRLTITLALAVLGVVVLGVAAFFLLKTRRPADNVTVRPNTNVVPKDPSKDEPKLPSTTPIETPKTVTPATPLSTAEIAKLTNLLPNDTEYVQHWFFKDLFAPSHFVQEAVFKSPGALDAVVLSRKLGFNVADLDDVIRAERYSTPWKYTVLHFKNALHEAQLKAALNLRLAGPPIEGQTYYKMTDPHPEFDTLARFSFAVPNWLTYFAPRRDERETYVRVHNPQTLIVGDKGPVEAFLKAKGEFQPLSPRTAPPPSTTTPVEPKKAEPEKPGPGPKLKPGGPKGRPIKPGGNARLFDDERWQWGFARELDAPATTPVFYQQPESKPPAAPDPLGKDDPAKTPGGSTTPGADSRVVRDDMYLTIRPALKAALDRMEASRDPQDRILMSSTVDMEANRVEPKLQEYRDRVIRRPRHFWDITLMLREPTPRIRLLATVLLQRGELPRYQVRNEMSCGQDAEAKEIKKEIVNTTSFTIAQFIRKVVNHEVRLPPPPDKDAKQPATADAGATDKKPAPITSSQMTVNQRGNHIEFALDLILDNATLNQVHGITSLTAASLRVEMEAAASKSLRHMLAKSAHSVAVKGMTDRDVPPGRYPPGAFLRAKTPFNIDQEPRNRISWMAGLLPYMGQQHLYNRILFDQSWREPGNWMAGNAIVPQFLAPNYPDWTRRAAAGELPIDFGATHYVGIAGVGLDAASYSRSDAATAHKRGIFSNDGSASIDEIQKGRGLANTAAMIQIPHDGVTGVSPWIAGGGATLRGVPEKNSIAPFVLSKDKYDRPIEYKSKRGALVLMADGSVRFVEQSVSDDVFKAMCTVQGPAPGDFNLNTNPLTPLVPALDAAADDVPPPLPKKPAEKTKK